MPFVRDKIVINNNRDQGNNDAIRAEFQSLIMLGDELVALGCIKETGGLRDDMTRACKVYNQAQTDYLTFLREMVGKLAELVDSKTP